MKKILILSIGILVITSLAFVIEIIRRRPTGQVTPVAEKTEVDETEVKINYCAWLPWWDYENALKDLDKYAAIEMVFPFVYILEKDESISVKVEDFGEISDRIVIPTISNDFDAKRVSRIINSVDLREEHINALVQLVKEGGFNGIEIDYELLETDDRDAFSEFISLLGERLHSENLLLSIVLQYGAEAQDWQALSDVADIVKIMAYDFHWEESDPGAIAPLEWVLEVLTFAKVIIPLQKISLGVGFYGYDWEEGASHAFPVTIPEAEELAKEHNIEVAWDENSQSPYYEYKLDDKKHFVWLENEKSISLKLELAKNNDIENVCIWRLGNLPDYEILR